ncbi:MAG TPA: hypothetical protein PKC76_13755 [Saprospiraceae bacterium]|nr:hypothetical protein [Saprospiraceae bacterium]HMP25200.1 hypothetical protein [Saprospiraceae bacterium]
MLLQRIAGFILLLLFVGFMVYKFIVLLSDQSNVASIAFFAVLILIILLLAIRKILTD